MVLVAVTAGGTQRTGDRIRALCAGRVGRRIGSEQARAQIGSEVGSVTVSTPRAGRTIGGAFTRSTVAVATRSPVVPALAVIGGPVILLPTIIPRTAVVPRGPILRRPTLRPGVAILVGPTILRTAVVPRGPILIRPTLRPIGTIPVRRTCWPGVAILVRSAILRAAVVSRTPVLIRATLPVRATILRAPVLPRTPILIRATLLVRTTILRTPVLPRTPILIRATLLVRTTILRTPVLPRTPILIRPTTLCATVALAAITGPLHELAPIRPPGPIVAAPRRVARAAPESSALGRTSGRLIPAPVRLPGPRPAAALPTPSAGGRSRLARPRSTPARAIVVAAVAALIARPSTRTMRTVAVTRTLVGRVPAGVPATILRTRPALPHLTAAVASPGARRRTVRAGILGTFGRPAGRLVITHGREPRWSQQGGRRPSQTFNKRRT